MRYIKDIPNNFCKTSLYNFNNKYIIKLEAGDFEQIYKVSELNLDNDVNFDTFLDEEFFKKAIEHFKEMQWNFDRLLM